MPAATLEKPTSDPIARDPEQTPERAPAVASVDEPAAPRRGRKIVVAALIALVLVSVGVAYWLHWRQFESTDDAFIEADVVSVSPQVSGRVKTLLVTDNQFVHKGDVLLEIDPADLEMSVQQADAGVLAAKTRVSESEAQVALAGAQLAEAQADVQSKAATERTTLATLERLKKMDVTAVTQQELSDAQGAYDEALADRRAADAKVQSAQAQVTNVQAALKTAAATVAIAETRLNQAKLSLSYTHVTAPYDGRVTKRNVEVGAYLTTGQPVMALVSDHVWVTANFKETQLEHLRVGQPVEVDIDAYSHHPLKAHVDSIQRGTGARFSLLPPENATGNFVKVVQRVPVKIVFDEAIPDGVVLAPGMSVEPAVKVR